MKKSKKTVSKKKPVKRTIKPKARAVGRPKKTTAVKPAKPAKVAKAAKRGPKPAPPVVEAPPKKLKLSKEQAKRYEALLLNLRDHLIDGVNFLASDNLKRSHRDASGELSGYSLHMADAGTDNFDREFALSLVSSEQEALYEIEEALKRLEQGTYGLCDQCEKQIGKERLGAVPFTRLCIQCQSAMEKNRARPALAGAVFSESADDESADSDDSEEK